jgi:GTPase
MKIPVIAIVGRPNVGKSTLFNRLIGERKAIVEDFPGVTRDRNYHLIEDGPFPHFLVDTGGFEKDPEEELKRAAVAQTLAACEEADALIVLFDGIAGLQVDDHDLLEVLRKYAKPATFVVNKCDGAEHVGRTADFYSLGIDELIDISALHNRNVRSLTRRFLEALPNFAELEAAERERRLSEKEAVKEAANEAAEESAFVDHEDDIIDEPAREPVRAPVSFAPMMTANSDISPEEYDDLYRLVPLEKYDERSGEDDAETDEAEEEEKALPEIRLAIIGRPNVGKSTLFNTLAGEQRAIVSSIAGTTRDALDITIERDGQNYVLVDTAGLRREGRVDEGLERYSALRSINAVSDCDVAVLVIDASEGPTDQDAKIASLAHDGGKGIVIAINKWDLVEKDHRTAHEFKQRVKEAFKFAPYAKQIFTSAISGRRCVHIFDEAVKIAKSRERRVSTSKLNRVLKRELSRVSPPNYRGGPIKLYFASQIDTAPPRFVLFFNYPKNVHFSYLRFIKNVIREKLGYEGTDIKFKLASRRGESAA